MALKNYSTVILLTNRFKEEGVKSGDLGTIIEVYNNGEEYEVDFSDEKGITIAQIVVQENELKLQEPTSSLNQSNEPKELAVCRLFHF